MSDVVRRLLACCEAQAQRAAVFTSILRPRILRLLPLIIPPPSLLELSLFHSSFLFVRRLVSLLHDIVSTAYLFLYSVREPEPYELDPST